MKKSLLVIIMFFLLISCKKETEIMPENQDPWIAKYYVINQGDANMYGVAVWTTTTFPENNSASFFDRVFNPVRPTDTLLVTIDGPHSNPVTIGSTTLMKVRVHFKEPVYSKFPHPLLNDSKAYVKNYIGKRDTIRSSADAIVTFKWPEDTLNFEQVLYF